MIVVLKEFNGRKSVRKFIGSVEIIVVKGDKNVKVKVNGMELKL